jgi:hypothetical protein
MLSRRTLIGALALMIGISLWREHRPRPLVVLGAAGRDSAIREAMQQIEGVVSGRVDTVDLTQPHALRIAVYLPTGARKNPDEDPIRGHVDDVLMEAHAHLVWSRLAPFRLYTAFDTVTVMLQREYRSPFGLWGWQRHTRGQRYAGPWQRGRAVRDRRGRWGRGANQPVSNRVHR